MSYAPDYGLRMLKDGYSPDTIFHLPGFHMFAISLIGEGQYSTTVNVPYGDEPHALSLDFNQEQLEQILKNADPKITLSVWNEIKRDPRTPRPIILKGVIIFDVEAKIGNVITNENESYAPLIAQKILTD